jgi:hypothetical protein
MFFVRHVLLRSYSTFSTVLGNLAVNLPLKQTFVRLTPAMTPSLSFYHCTSCFLPICAFWAIERCDTFLLRWYIRPYMFKLEIPIDFPRMRGFEVITPPWDETYQWDAHKTHPWPKLRQLMYNMWASGARGRLWACPSSHRKKTPPVNNITHMESRDPPANHYQLWPTWWSRRHNQVYKLLLWSVEGFLCEVLKMAVSYTLRPLPITQCRALPPLHVMNKKNWLA